MPQRIDEILFGFILLRPNVEAEPRTKACRGSSARVTG